MKNTDLFHVGGILERHSKEHKRLLDSLDPDTSRDASRSGDGDGAPEPYGRHHR